MNNENQQIELFNPEDIILFEDSRMINVPSSAIHIENKMSLVQKKLWFELVYHAFPKMGSQRYHSIPLKKLRHLLGWQDNTSNDTELKEALKGLNQTTVSWNIFGKDKGKVWESFPLLAGCRIPENSGICIFEFSSFLEERFLSMGEEAYVKIDLIISKKFQSKYALSIYCLALDYLMLELGYSEKKFSLEELRRYLALKQGEYKLTADMNRWIIQPSEREINDTSDMNIEIKPFKDGKKIAGYKLCMSLKEGRAKEYLDKKNKLKQINTNNLLSETENTKSKLVSKIIIENEILKKFFLENNISVMTETVQERLATIKTEVNNIENYLLFLMNYSQREYKKGSIKNLSGFFVASLKDNLQIDNYIFHLEEIKQKELYKEKTLNKHIKIELDTKYENYLSNDFQNYIDNNIDKLEHKITEYLDNTIKQDTFVYQAIILRKMSGIFSIQGYKKLPKSHQLPIIAELKKNQDYFGYRIMTYDEWATKYVNPEIIDLIKNGILSKSFS